jgi:hypothetical protein
MRVMYGAERAKAVNTTFFISIALDHKLYARASLNFRGRQRYDAAAYGNYEGENQHDLCKLVVLVRMSVANDDGDTDFAVIEPYFDVCDIIATRA